MYGVSTTPHKSHSVRRTTQPWTMLDLLDALVTSRGHTGAILRLISVHRAERRLSDETVCCVRCFFSVTDWRKLASANARHSGVLCRSRLAHQAGQFQSSSMPAAGVSAAALHSRGAHIRWLPAHLSSAGRAPSAVMQVEAKPSRGSGVAAFPCLEPSTQRRGAGRDAREDT